MPERGDRNRRLGRPREVAVIVGSGAAWYATWYAAWPVTGRGIAAPGPT
jgi:hypothetical protein